MLYGVLFFIVKHADGILRRQEVERRRSEAMLRKLHDDLELKVRMRTAELTGANERLHLSAQVFESSGEAIIITDNQNRIVSANQAFARITGYMPEEVIGRDPKLLASGRHDRAFYQNMWHAITGAGYWQGEIWDRRKNGEIYPKRLAISAVKDESGEIANYIASFSDITEHKEADERIRYMAHHDALTRLPNRTLLQDRLEQAIAAAERSKKRVGLLLLDLDRFKNINDTLGHSTGDLLLQAVAERLKGHIRDDDTLARLGGDEFIIVLPGMDQVEDAAYVAQKILNAMTQSFSLDGHDLNITPSIGISIYPNDTQEIEILIRNADTAMYRAKENGRNNYQFFTQDMNTSAFERLLLENNLRHALERDEFVLHYQPQVNVETGCIIGVEALIRWQHPDMGLVAPAKFIPVAEECGLIVAIGEWVLETACAQNRQWQEAGVPAIPVSVNLSAAQFHQQDIQETVAYILQKENLAPCYLELELTEGVIIQDAEATIVTLKALKSIGVQLSIDDFGTGYSSLSYLKRFEVDKLKIDQSFLRDIATDPINAAIAIAIIAMAKALNLRVIAEGVETKEQLMFLRSQRCDEIQGYYFSKPVSADVFMQMLEAGQRLEIG